MALLNRLFPYSNFRNGNPFSLTSGLSLRRNWNPSTLASRWRFNSGHIFSNKPIAYFTSHTGQEQAVYSHILDTTQGKKILWMDLDTREYGLGEVVKYSPDFITRKEIPEMMKKLRRFIEEDMQKAPSECIDSVVWYTKWETEPTARMWQVLDGLSPKHLELFALMDEDCHIKPLNTLQHQWNDLESLTLRNIGNHDFMKRAPKSFSRISSLTLDHCVGPEYFPPGITHLKHLRALENGCCDMFCYGVDNVPNLTKVLEVLEIKSTNGCDFANIYYPQDFKDRLRKCTNLREFHLAAGYRDNLDIDLASYIPPSVEKLTLRYTRSLPFLHDIDDWIKHASDETWLPRLKTFKLTVDPESRIGGLEGDVKSRQWTRNLENPREFSLEVFDIKFEGKRRVLYDMLKSNRPFIDLLT